jgi:hypothetical protein
MEVRGFFVVEEVVDEDLLDRRYVCIGGMVRYMDVEDSAC